MKTEHPITPRPGLVAMWAGFSARHYLKGSVDYLLDLANKAARWGADQELEACCEWLNCELGTGWGHGTKLRAARRPKPPGLKEQALAELELLRGDANAHGLGFDAPAIRRALEQLDD